MTTSITGQINTILLFSNPFGYGPTITMLHIIEELSKRTGVRIIVAGERGGLCEEIFSRSKHSKVEWLNINERSIEDVRKLIAKYQSAGVISVLNRFSIRAAHELGIPNAIVDFLSWFWNKPPDEYRLADIYFTNNLKRDAPSNGPRIRNIPIILGPIPPRKISKQRTVLINIGGVLNPISIKLPERYLALFSEIINGLRTDNTSVHIAGGEKALHFVRKLISNTTYNISSIPHERFLSLQSKCSRFISLSGTNATFMSLAIGTPSFFLLPQLQAHWKLSLLLEQAKIPTLLWEHYYPIKNEIYMLSEREIIGITESLSAKTLANPKLLDEITQKVQKFIDTPAEIASQNKFIKNIGVNGEKHLVSILIERWGLK